jgi:hypothetical protein
MMTPMIFLSLNVQPLNLFLLTNSILYFPVFNDLLTKNWPTTNFVLLGQNYTVLLFQKGICFTHFRIKLDG